MNPLDDTTAAPVPPATAVAGELSVARASSQEWEHVMGWAAEEQWNPGLGDAECFHTADPGGFFIGRVEGRPVSAVSVVNYSPEYAFLGFYLVDPAYRGRGLGHATWRAAVPHAGERVIGLDAVPEQEATYRRSGFTHAYRNLRYVGRPGGTAKPGTEATVTADGTVTPGGTGGSGGPAGGTDTVRVTGENLDALLGRIGAYDLNCFPSARRAFLARWLTAPGHHAYVRLAGARVTGYGAVRPAQDGFRIGPLFADTAGDAGALLDALSAHAAGGDGPRPVWMDIPEPHTQAQALAASRGFAEDSWTVRMYAGPAPVLDAERVFASTSLELG